MKKFFVSDSPPEELWIEQDDDSEQRSDGEFIFDDLDEAKEACFDQIDWLISYLRETRAKIAKIEER